MRAARCARHQVVVSVVVISGAAGRLPIYEPGPLANQVRELGR
jgi:hypothetical protein